MSNKKATSFTNYKQMSDELDEILAKFDNPDTDIEQSIEYYKSAVELIKKIENYLNTAKNHIEQIDKKTG